MKTYLIIGRGRCARHFDHYLTLLNIPHFLWHRSDSAVQVEQLAEKADRILLLITDSAIDEFFNSHTFLPAEKLVHFSGVLSHAKIQGAHPLMTFGPNLYDLNTYKKIPFICEKPGPDGHALSFAELLPDLPNPHFYLEREKKPYYHALCAMSGNFTTILWESIFDKFKEDLKLPREVLLPYLERTFVNLRAELTESADKSVLTGPLQRGDTKTLAKHLDALQGQPEQSLYFSFMNYFFEREATVEILKQRAARSL